MLAPHNAKYWPLNLWSNCKVQGHTTRNCPKDSFQTGFNTIIGNGDKIIYKEKIHTGDTISKKSLFRDPPQLKSSQNKNAFWVVHKWYHKASYDRLECADFSQEAKRNAAEQVPKLYANIKKKRLDEGLMKVPELNLVGVLQLCNSHPGDIVSDVYLMRAMKNLNMIWPKYCWKCGNKTHTGKCNFATDDLNHVEGVLQKGCNSLEMFKKSQMKFFKPTSAEVGEGACITDSESSQIEVIATKPWVRRWGDIEAREESDYEVEYKWADQHNQNGEANNQFEDEEWTETQYWKPNDVVEQIFDEETDWEIVDFKNGNKRFIDLMSPGKRRKKSQDFIDKSDLTPNCNNDVQSTWSRSEKESECKDQHTYSIKNKDTEQKYQSKMTEESKPKDEWVNEKQSNSEIQSKISEISPDLKLKLAIKSICHEKVDTPEASEAESVTDFNKLFRKRRQIDSTFEKKRINEMVHNTDSESIDEDMMKKAKAFVARLAKRKDTKAVKTVQKITIKKFREDESVACKKTLEPQKKCIPVKKIKKSTICNSVISVKDKSEARSTNATSIINKDKVEENQINDKPVISDLKPASAITKSQRLRKRMNLFNEKEPSLTKQKTWSDPILWDNNSKAEKEAFKPTLKVSEQWEKAVESIKKVVDTPSPPPATHKKRDVKLKSKTSEASEATSTDVEAMSEHQADSCLQESEYYMRNGLYVIYAFVNIKGNVEVRLPDKIQWGMQYLIDSSKIQINLGEWVDINIYEGQSTNASKISHICW